jgi:hypothetical protein
VFRDTSQLYTYLTTRMSDIPGLQSAETAPIIGTVKKESPLVLPHDARRTGT